VAGVVAAGMALAVTEVVTALGGARGSLVAAVGADVIDRTPGAVARMAIDAFGTADKALVLLGVVALCLGLGALVGSASSRRPWVAPVAFVAAGGLGVAASASNGSGMAVGSAVTAAALGAVAGWATLALLLAVLATGWPRSTARDRRWPPATDEQLEALGPVHAQPIALPGRAPGGAGRGDRRAFLAWSGAAAAFAGLAAAGARSWREQVRPAVARTQVILPPATPLPGGPPVSAPEALEIRALTPLITPNDRFYRIDTALVVPRVDVADWRLEVGGAVPDPYSLTFDELCAMPMVATPVTMACVSNEVGGELVGNAVWQGVPLAALLERAGVHAGSVGADAAQLVGRSVDGFTAGFPTDAALDGRVALVAVGMNGEPLPDRHGFPARLVVAGLYGYVSATKWLRRIELTGWDDFDAYWVPRGWSKEGPVKTQSRIDVPGANADLRAGRVPVAGVAWAPTRGIAKVEVRVDEGPWREARLGASWDDAVWRQWVFDWDATPGRHRLEVRATDGRGDTQTSERSRVDPDGATGWHSRTVTVAG
jgi:DMSO/TMAO reductase YedYZ molybdopterin-dependent catalytic subunit